jgi:hypothetical protein
VARTVYITVPHRYFPVEHHTGFPLVHYSSWLFSQLCHLTGKDEWALEKNLIFMTRNKLNALVPAHTQRRIGFTGLQLGVFSSNLYLAIQS